MTDKQQTITLPRGTLSLTYASNPSLNYELDDLLDFAQRINPKRAFLFVSKVLGRHIPVAPSIMRQAFSDLANLIPDGLPEPIVVIGMAETAVGLSAGVHHVLQTRYPKALILNSTRHAQDATLFAQFSEDHSHASQHLIYASDDPNIQSQLLESRTLIMVDDEASTGNTCVNVVTALREAGLTHLEQVHLATLVDWSLGQSNMRSDFAERIGNTGNVKFSRHHLLAGDWRWTDAPTDALNTQNLPPIQMPKVDTTEAGTQPIGHTGNWGRLPTQDSSEGFASYHERFLHAYQAKFTIPFDADKLDNKRILVLGSNEFVWLPFLLAQWLEHTLPQHDVKFSALTRSPIALGGAIETVLSFQDNYGLGMTNFVYNVTPNEWDLIVLCIETSADSVDTLWQGLDNVLVVGTS